MDEVTMSQSDAAMRPGVGGMPLPPSLQSETGVANLPAAVPAGSGAAILLAARKAASFPVLMGVLLAGASMVGSRLMMLDPDTWWHIAVGQRIMDTHIFPTADPYSFSAPGVHWIAYEWLGEVAMALAARAGGLMGLAALQIVLVAIVTVLLYYYAYVRCGNWKAACLGTAFVLPIASVIFTLRPQIFGYIFLLVTLICLERFRQGHSRALWVLPPLFLIWVNTHGTFVFGLAAIGAYFACGLVKFQLGNLVAETWTARQRMQLLLTLFFSSLAILVTPYGTQLAGYPVVMATSQPFNIANISEWQPLSFTLAIGKYFLALMLVMFLAHIFFPMKYRLYELAMLLFAVYAACVHIRFMLIFLMILAPVVAAFIVRWMPAYDPGKERYAFNLLIIALLVVWVAKLMPGRTEVANRIAKDYPVAAIQYMRQHSQPSPMFNDYGYGGYLIWQLGPEQKVFIDGRADMYEYSGVFQDYAHIANLERDALSVLGKYGIQSCLIKRKSALATLLAASPDWKQAYADDNSAIFVRSRAASPSGN
jgi:hypothetical protein